MDPKTITLVPSTWEHVAARAPQVAALFYHHLFAADPSFPPLFAGHLEEQGKKLMQMLGTVVGRLNGLEALVPILGLPYHWGNIQQTSISICIF